MRKGRYIILLWVVFAISIAFYSYLAWNETYYRLGVFLIPVVLILSGLFAIVYYFISIKSKPFSLAIGLSLASILFIFLCSAILIENYKPNLKIRIPKDYFGDVYLFAIDEESREIIVDSNGIGYFEWYGDYDIKIKHGDSDITDVLGTSNSNEIVLFEDENIIKVINIWCFEIRKDNIYPKNEYDRVYIPCMDSTDYLSLVNKGRVDTSLIKIRTFYK